MSRQKKRSGKHTSLNGEHGTLVNADCPVTGPYDPAHLANHSDTPGKTTPHKDTEINHQVYVRTLTTPQPIGSDYPR